MQGKNRKQLKKNKMHLSLLRRRMFTTMKLSLSSIYSPLQHRHRHQQCDLVRLQCFLLMALIHPLLHPSIVMSMFSTLTVKLTIAGMSSYCIPRILAPHGQLLFTSPILPVSLKPTLNWQRMERIFT